jgi:hypothetical protein
MDTVRIDDGSVYASIKAKAKSQKKNKKDFVGEKMSH